MAVVIQSMVEPRAAGVMFTINPLTGSWREMTIEAAWGLGDAVVSGRIVPDLYRIRRPRRAPRVGTSLLARLRLTILEKQVREQESQERIGSSGTVEEAVGVGIQADPKLSDSQILKLCRLGLRVESLLGAPQDIEWAITGSGELHLLQARPVTTTRDVRRSAPVVWTRRFGGERWSDPVTPLGWSSIQPQLDWFIAYPETAHRYFGGSGATRLYRQAPYFNVTVFRHLAFKLPGAAPPRFMVELLPPDEERGWLRRHAMAPDLRVYRSILAETFAERRWERFRWNLFRNWEAWEEFRQQLDESLHGLEPVTSAALATDRIELCKSLLRGYIGVHICSLLFANIWYELSSAALKRKGLEALTEVVLRAPGTNATVQTHQALWELAHGRRDLASVVEEFGHRAANSWALFSSRWSEDPEQVQILSETVGRGPEPAVLASQKHQETQEALESLSGLVGRLVGLSRRYLQLREDQRFHFDRILWEWKKTLLWMEEDQGMELRFLEEPEVHALLEGRLERTEAQAWIERRRMAWKTELERRRNGDDPPVFLGEGTSEEHVGRRLQGMGISSGVVTAPVRVIRSMEDASLLRPGEVLVTRSTDPGWTPLFLTASALVMELGGMLSHGAVVAREYRLPGVVNLSGAMESLKDGQVVTVDGTRGTVWIR
jgi:pyruvate,water dikinase